MESKVLFWILLVLAAIAGFPPDNIHPYFGRAKWIVVLILIALLGWKTFGEPH